MKWTAEKDQKLAELYAADVPGSAIAHALGCTKSAVTKRAYRLGISDPVRQQNSRKDAKRIAHAYNMGREHRQAGGEKVVPANLPPIRRAWWLAGWHDADMETAA